MMIRRFEPVNCCEKLILRRICIHSNRIPCINVACGLLKMAEGEGGDRGGEVVVGQQDAASPICESAWVLSWRRSRRVSRDAKLTRIRIYGGEGDDARDARTRTV